MNDSSSATAAPAAVRETHPAGFWFFFWGEFAERSSYYGMRAILPMYLTTALHMTDIEGNTVFYTFKMWCYLLPLVGGFLADRYFGKYWTIVGFSVPYVLGHFILGIPDIVAMGIALMLLACGSGVTKPNISALMGETYDQLRPGQLRLRSAAFMWYYFAINVGALLSTFALPAVRDAHGYSTAFHLPAWLMAAALVIFAAGRPFYAVESVASRRSTPDERRDQLRTLAQLSGLFAVMVFFWVVYEQCDSLWVFFIRDYVQLTYWLAPFVVTKVPPDQIQSLNPLCVLIMVPLFTMFFKRVDPEARVFPATRKILIGFVLGASSAGLMALAGLMAESSGEKVSILWPMAAYILLTAGEVLFYGTGLELSYAVAPKNMKGFVTACFLVTVTIANFINTFLTQLYGGSLKDPVSARGPLQPSGFFALTALIGLAATVAFYFVGRRFDRRQR